MKILITGGAGFIGSHLSERLLKEGHSVVIVDDLNDFYSPARKRANLRAIADIADVPFYEADICDEDRMRGIFAAHRPHAVIHLAARAGVRPSLDQPLLYERVNVGGTMVLLEMARRFDVFSEDDKRESACLAVCGDERSLGRRSASRTRICSGCA